MPYVVAIVIAITGLAIVRDTMLFAKVYGLCKREPRLAINALTWNFLVCLAWFIFKETITKTYTIRKQ